MLSRWKWAWTHAQFSLRRDLAVASIGAMAQTLYLYGTGQADEVINDLVAIAISTLAGGVFVPALQFLARAVTARREQAELALSALTLEHQAVVAQLKDAEARPRVSRADWQKLAADFRSVPDTAVRGIWSSGSFGEEWTVGGGSLYAVRPVQALCKLAGSMLIDSRMAPGLPESVIAQRDPVWRWLAFLKERPGAFNLRLIGEEISMSGARYPSYQGDIGNLPLLSADVCVECSADET